MMKPLVNIPGAIAKSNVVVHVTAPECFSFSSRASLANKAIAETLRENRLVECCTHGEFSLHELVHALLAKVGPSKVLLSSWTMKNAPAKLFYNLKKTGLITEVHAVLDYRSRTMDAKIYPFISEVFDSVTLAKMHAKCCVILNDVMPIVIVSTANFADNNRIELVLVSTIKSSVDFHTNWINKIINKHGV